MEIGYHHDWSVSINEARQIQIELLEKIRLQKLKNQVKFIAGADVSYSKKENRCFGIVKVFEFPAMNVIEKAIAIQKVMFPYIPGFLTFREAPVLIEAFSKIKIIPDLIIFDGQGIAHPRSMGIAAHLGIVLNLPSIGCAKKRLVGTFEEPGEQRGSISPLLYNDREIGAVVRTRTRVKPVFISPGYAIDIEDAVTWILKTCSKYRLPEPIRQSHLEINSLRASYEGKSSK